MNKPPPIRSMDARFDEEGFEAVKSDIDTLSVSVASTSDVIRLNGPTRVQVPVSGVAQVYMVSDTATAGSSIIDYHVIKCLRCGQDEGGRAVDTQQAELPAYSVRYLGTFTVGADDVLALSLVVTGAPTPTLTIDNLTMRVDLTPQE